MNYRYAVIDRMAEGDRYDDPRKIVSRHATHAAAERAVDRRCCGDRYAIIDYERQRALSEAARAMGKRGGSARTERKQAASRLNGRKGGRPRRATE